MPAHVKRQGHYKLLKTDHDHTILDLQDDAYYAWIEGQKSPLLVRTDEDHEFVKTIREGEFRYVEFEDDPEYKDMPHLFLQKGDNYEEIVLPNGLPTKGDHQKRLVPTDNHIAKRELDDYLKHPAPAGPGENRLNRKRGRDDDPDLPPDLPIKDYAAKTVSDVEEALGELSTDELEQVKQYEQQHQNRKTAKQAIDRALRQRDED
jgi:hypothetical protein